MCDFRACAVAQQVGLPGTRDMNVAQLSVIGPLNTRAETTITFCSCVSFTGTSVFEASPILIGADHLPPSL